MTNTCHHLHDNGDHCKSAAVTAQNFCTFHLRHRARGLRMAQYRARSERFDLKLPPLESMFAVQSALNQFVEAVAADMIDLKRADFLLKALRFAAQALKSSDKWLAQRLSHGRRRPRRRSRRRIRPPPGPRHQHPSRTRLPANSRSLFVAI